MSVHEIWVGPKTFLAYRFSSYLQKMVWPLQYENDNIQVLILMHLRARNVWNHNIGTCSYCILCYHVFACIALWIYLSTLTNQENCSKKQLSGHFSGASSCSLSTASKQAWTPQMKLYHRGTDCQRIPSVSCPSCSTSSGIFMGICASWECGSQKEILIQSSTTSSSVAVFV